MSSDKGEDGIFNNRNKKIYFKGFFDLLKYKNIV